MERLMTRFGITFLTVFVLCGVLSAGAQEMMWENITALHFAATGGTDEEHALQQWLLFDTEVAEANADLFDRYKVFCEEFTQMTLNGRSMVGLKELEESEAEIRRMIKEHPELAQTLQESLKEHEEARKTLLSSQDQSAVSYTYDPAILLRNLTRIAVNRKAYSAWLDIEGGLYAVSEGPYIGPVQEDAFMRPKVQEGHEFSWGAIDHEGHSRMTAKYDGFGQHFRQDDIIFLYAKEKDGSIRAGARGYDGRVRIPFVYESINSYNLDAGVAAVVKGGKIGMVTFDNQLLQPFEYVWAYPQGEWLVRKESKGPMGIVNAHGRLVIPLKYTDYWCHENGELKMLRKDGRLDVFNPDTYEFIRTDPAPEMF